MLNLKNPSNTILRSSWIVCAMALVVVVSLDWSSMCHPSPEGTAIKDQIRTVYTAKTASTSNTIASTSIELDSYSELTWKDLTDVEFKDVYVDELDAYYWKPIFGPLVKDLEGGKFYITGYIIPVDIDEDFYVLSRYPFANCFFCGGAGPETVIDLQFEGHSPREYATDERLSFAGELKLNADDVYQMNYILVGAHEHTP
ncbi:MAG TPA: DUF3299 domain-containing protein [Flavobacteriales bacterium]|nr:DUF3299 domain-containing protein [Flavobacteriales bacterium]HIK68224.1 DUF3299 domain-containing protein [Flavobacteriales bacterium]